MSLWRRVLDGLRGAKSERSDEAVIPYELLSTNRQAMNYGGALFTRDTDDEPWTYEGQLRGAPDRELAAKSPMTMTEIERFFIMKRFIGRVGDI